MRVTMMDVAKEAGVSKSTVSLVINGSNDIKLETQYRVRQAVEKLGYVPNVAARGLTTNQTQTLGVVFLTSNIQKRPYDFDSTTETLLYDTSNGIYTGLRDSRYALLTERFSVADSTSQLPSIVKNGRVDGVFLVGGLFTTEFIEQLRKINLPVVIIGRRYEGIDCVYSEMETAGYLAGKELLQTGHKKILFLNGPSTSLNSQRKLAGIQAAWKDFGETSAELKVICSPAYSGQSAYDVLGELWAEGYRPDGIFGGSDGISAGAVRFLYQKGVRIPDDISLIGYESSILSQYACIPITVIDTHKEKMGEEACRVLLNRIERPKSTPVSLAMEPTLIHGASIAQR